MSTEQSWRPVRIGDLIRESRIKGSNGSSAKKLTIRLYGRGIVASSDRGGSEATNYFRRKAGQFAYSKLDCLNGAFGIVPEHLDGYETTLDLPAFDFLGKVDPDWFLKMVSRPAFYGRFKFAAIGSRKANRVPTVEFLATRLSIPPLAEQRAIAEVLGAVDNAIAKTEASIEAITQTLNKTVSWVLENAKSVAVPTVSFGEVIESTKYGTSAKCDDNPSGFPVLRIPNVLSHGVDQGHLKYADLPPDEAKKFELRDGDLLAVRTNGNPEYVGRMALIKDLPRGTLYASYLIRIRVDQKKVLPEFVWLSSETFPLRDSLTAAATTSAGNFNINSDGLKSARLPLPSMDVQKEVVAAAEILRLRRSREQEYLEQLRDTSTALAQELLSGRLRLPESMIGRHRDQPERAA
ncbi:MULTISPECIES: restriction endonuclease subunit S [unclassified Neorhizobium]|uniref:restriction endonuclease subunit S n=1 Tax=unclassified Neorhizobium TaxID=2629175 RepID=UPI001FF62224|nr:MULTISPECIES: restriction endonuclease subunit S [unclassified Neorhizobium]MCJ9669017.1 restriction endonuclease subunit S [Neorhizobium sp. SHOUNA12B]MCJ9744971.1 restriction endonuclease subunit S [Neorhizobium sp. SHOUNA12A]